MRAVIVLAGLALTACAYDPPVAADHTAPQYLADLQACRQSVDARVDLQGRTTFPRFLMSPFTGPPRKRAGIRDCMVAKGYALT
jgi:hypothetical protein